LNPSDLPRLTAATALAGTALAAALWLGPAALRAGAPALAGLVLLLLPLAFGLRGLLAGRLRTGRWLTLLLPFYAAMFLVGAVGNPGARGAIAAGAFCVALAFAATISWVRRARPPEPGR
jgi:uncharacterized membrane protein